MRDAEVNFLKIEAQFSERKMNLNIVETGAVHLLTARHSYAFTARTALQCAVPDKEHALCSTRVS